MRMTINGHLVYLEAIEGHGYCATVGTSARWSVYGYSEIEVMTRVASLLA